MGMFDATFAVLLCFSCCFVCIIACGSQENVMFVVLQRWKIDFWREDFVTSLTHRINEKKLTRPHLETENRKNCE